MYGSRRSRTPASRATSRAATSISVRRNTWRRTRGASIASGVRLVGGCCGTTPEHIRQIALAAKSMAPGLARRDAPAPTSRRRSRASRTRRPPVPRAEKSALAKQAGERPVRPHVELLPPRGHAPTEALAAAARCAKRDVDVVTIPDGPRTGARHERAVDGGARAAARRQWKRCCSIRVGIATCWASSRTCSARTRWACATCSASPAMCAAWATSRMRRRCSTSIRSG